MTMKPLPIPSTTPGPQWGSMLNDSITEIQDLLDTSGRWLDVTRPAYGVKNDGSAGAVTGILAACQDALTPDAHGKPSHAVYVPAGRYLLDRSLDFSTLNYTGLTGGGGAATDPNTIEGFTFICDPGAVFELASGVTGVHAVHLAPPSTWQFFGCEFRFGIIIDPNKGTQNNGLTIQSVNDSRIYVTAVQNFANSGFLGNPATDVGIFNNYIDIRLLRDCTYGFATVGNALPSLYGFQGNEVHLGQVANNQIGVNIDANGVGRTTQWNTFHCSAVENSSAQGISDASGENTWIISSATANAAEAFVLVPGAWFTPVVIGNLANSGGSVNLNGGKARMMLSSDKFDDTQVTGTDTTFTGTATTAVTGLTCSVNSPGSHAAYLVNVALDVSSTLANGGTTFIGVLQVDGTEQPVQMIADMPTSGPRNTTGQVYRLTGLSAGSHTLQVAARLTGTGGSYKVGGAHSTLTVTRVR